MTGSGSGSGSFSGMASGAGGNSVISVKVSVGVGMGLGVIFTGGSGGAGILSATVTSAGQLTAWTRKVALPMSTAVPHTSAISMSPETDFRTAIGIPVDFFLLDFIFAAVLS